MQNVSSALTGPAPHLLTPREAAETLRISDRTLWTLTQRGDVPCVRIGRSVRYDADDLRQFVARQKEVQA